MLHTNQIKAIDCALIFFSGLLLFTIGLNHQEIIGFESRFYLFALEMWRHGVSWFPVTYQQPYPDYPVTSTLLIYFFAKLFNTLSKLTAVLPSAMAASLTLVMTYLIGALHTRRWGLGATIFLLITLSFVSEARTISVDQYVTLVTVSCFYLLYSEKLLQTHFRIYLLFPLLVLGFMFRGPIGLVIPTGVMCVFYLIERDFKKFLVMGAISALLLSVCILVLMAIAYHVGGMNFVGDVLRLEVVGRIHDAKSVSSYFYFIESFGVYAITYPLMVFMLPGVLVKVFKNNALKENRFLLHLLGWILIILVGLSFPADKKPRYILAIAPALALFCSYLLVCKEEEFYLRWVKNSLYWVMFFVPTLALVALYLVHRQLSFMYLHYLAMIGLFVFLQLIIFIGYLFSKATMTNVLVVVMLSFLMTYIGVVEPTNLKLNRTHDFVVEVENIRLKKQAKLVFYREDADGWSIKYVINIPQEASPFFIQSLEELIAFNQPAIFMTTEDYFQVIPEEVKSHLQVLAQGKIGSDKVIVFNKNVSHPRAGF